MISIVTATYNAVDHLPLLIQSLRDQTCKKFEWVVVDGCSTDGTLELLEQVSDLKVIVDSRPDFGIYDALNRALELCSNDYYLVVGADDIVYPDTIGVLCDLVNKDYDLYVGKVRADGIMLSAKRHMVWRYGHLACVSCHSVGVLIKKSLHYRFGYYSKNYPIAADQFFILRVYHCGCKFYYSEEVFGEYSFQGISSRDHLGALSEFFRVQVYFGYNIFVQLFLFNVRLLCYFLKKLLKASLFLS